MVPFRAHLTDVSSKDSRSLCNPGILCCLFLVFVLFVIFFCRENEEDKEMADFLNSKLPRKMKTGMR